jgi:hypothetical protein
MAEENEAQIPTEEEIELLPRWAQVAFAARCARRVQPLILHDWPDAPQVFLDNIDKAITLAEASAADPASASEKTSAATRAFAFAFAATRASAFVDDAADAAADAATRASAASAFVDDAADAAAFAFAATRASASATRAFAAFARAAVRAIRADFELLGALARREGWDNDTPVPPEVFGPMWPEGVPEGWPNELVAPVRNLDTDCIAPPLSLYFDGDEFTPEQISEIIGGLSNMYEEMTGDHLVIDTTGVLQIPVLEGVTQ